jgi:hypothetical protein
MSRLVLERPLSPKPPETRQDDPDQERRRRQRRKKNVATGRADGAKTGSFDL